MKNMHKCPSCGLALKVRINRKTQHKFWGCSGFPDCSYTTPYREYIPGTECPRCKLNGVPSLLHRVRFKDRTFLGCSNYPACSYATRDMRDAIGIPSSGLTSNAYLADVLTDVINQIKAEDEETEECQH